MNQESSTSVNVEVRTPYEAPTLVREQSWQVLTGTPQTSGWKV